MSAPGPTKINRLLSSWPKGTVATARWLRSKGIAPDLLLKYRRTGWVETLGRGAAVRAGESVAWSGAVYAMQAQLGMSVHPGGKTALGLLGRAHYVPMGKERVDLFCDAGEASPAWFRNHDWGAKIRVLAVGLFPPEAKAGLTRLKQGDFEMAVSSAERAAIELLYCVPGSETFDEARLLFEGLPDLRPDVLRQLLEQCASVKVKRLFMVLAEHFHYPWLEKLDTAKVDFGKGKRVAAKAGMLNKKYSITVPRDWQETESAR
jgi:hypothetical protein